MNYLNAPPTSKEERGNIMANTSLGRVAYILALVGGILMVLLGLLGLLGHAMMSFGMPHFFGGPGAGILTLILGVVAIICSKRATDLVWAIILIVIGLIGGGTSGALGGLLVLIGGILGLISKYVH